MYCKTFLTMCVLSVFFMTISPVRASLLPVGCILDLAGEDFSGYTADGGVALVGRCGDVRSYGADQAAVLVPANVFSRSRGRTPTLEQMSVAIFSGIARPEFGAAVVDRTHDVRDCDLAACASSGESLERSPDGISESHAPRAVVLWLFMAALWLFVVVLREFSGKLDRPMRLKPNRGAHAVG